VFGRVDIGRLVAPASIPGPKINGHNTLHGHIGKAAACKSTTPTITNPQAGWCRSAQRKHGRPRRFDRPIDVVRQFGPTQLVLGGGSGTIASVRINALRDRATTTIPQRISAGSPCLAPRLSPGPAAEDGGKRDDLLAVTRKVPGPDHQPDDAGRLVHADAIGIGVGRSPNPENKVGKHFLLPDQ
jgi:hypothetical protein